MDIEEQKQSIRQILRHPEALSAKPDGKRFAAYCERWRREDKRIGEIWREEESAFFSILFGGELFSRLEELRREDEAAYLEALSEIEAPYLLSECLLRILCGEDGWDAAVRLLEQAPPVVLPKENICIREDRISSVLAPVLLGDLTACLTHAAGGGRETEAEYETRLNRLVGVLRARDDGFFLAFHYVRHLLWLDREEPVYAYMASALSEAFSDDAAGELLVGGELAPLENEPLSTGAAERLSALGQLRRAGERDLLIDFRTAMSFLGVEGHEKPLFRTFMTVLASDSASFYTADLKWHAKHSDIAELLLSQDDVPAAWDELSGLLLSAREKLMQRYYGDQASSLRRNLSFLRLVSLRMLDGLWESGAETAQALWKRFWRAGLDDARRFSQDRDMLLYRYLSHLIVYYALCFAGLGENGESGSARRMTEQFEEIKTMPLLLLMSMDQLLANQVPGSAFLGEGQESFFRDAVRRALAAAEGRREYEWVERCAQKVSKAMDSCVRRAENGTPPQEIR